MDKAPFLLVVIGATTDGHKELVAVEDGIRESERSWKDLPSICDAVDWRWGLGILEGRGADLWDHQVATVLGT